MAGLTLYGGERRVPGLRARRWRSSQACPRRTTREWNAATCPGVSDSVLYSLARSLQLNEAETTHLLDLAHAASGPRPRTRRKPPPRVSERLSQMLDTMADVPALAMSRLGDPVGSNALGRALFPHLFPDDGAPLNHTRYLFLDPRARTFYPDWEHSAHEAVSALRLLAGHDPADGGLMSLIGELSTHCPEFRTWWGGHTVRIHASGTKVIDHPTVGLMTIGYDALEVASSPGLSIVTYLPEPGSPSADALDLLRSVVATNASAEVAP